MAKAKGVGVVRFIRGAADASADGADADLLRLYVVANDERAFATLVARYAPMVWAVCRRLLRNHHDAEDAVQATFLVFARKADGIRSGTAVGSWLYGVAARVAGRLRAKRRDEPVRTEPAASDPIDDLTLREAECVLHEELARLSERDRAVLVLCGLEGLTRDEAATRLGWSANRVKHALERGRSQLRVRLTRRGITLGLPLLTGLFVTPASAVPPRLVETAIRHATLAAPPPTVATLAHGVIRTMWIAKWKWTAAASAAVVLTGTLIASALGDAPAAAPTAAKPGPAVAFAAPVAAPEPKPGPPRPAWDIASDFLQSILDDKPDAARKLGEKLDERYIRELQVAGLTRVKLAMILIGDRRVLAITEQAKLKRAPIAEPIESHAVVQLERKDADSPWRVTGTDVADAAAVWREVDEYLAGKFHFDPPLKPDPKPDAKLPWGVAAECLGLALAGKTDEAIALTVPGTISANKIGEVKVTGTGTKVLAVLLNDTRLEVVFELSSDDRGTPGHVVLMLTKSADGKWLVKDFDFRDEERLEPRVQMYLGGQYNDKPKP